MTRVREHLRQVLLRRVDAGDGWLMAHAVLGLGPHTPWGETQLWEVLLRRHALASRDSSRLLFAVDGAGEPVEPHFGLIAKALASGGLSPEATFRARDGREHAVREVMHPRDAWPKLTSPVERANPPDATTTLASLDDTPWALEAAARWRTEPPHVLREVASAALDHLWQLHAPLRAQRALGAPPQRDGEGVYALTCGGAHVLQGILVVHGLFPLSDDASQRLEGLWETTVWRFESELGLLDASIASAPARRAALLGQRLKLTGHFLETLHTAAAAGVGLSDATRAQTRAARALAETVATLAVLEQREALLPAATGQEKARATRTLSGDAMHALHGIELALGAPVFP